MTGVRTARRPTRLIAGLFIAALLIAGVASYYASSKPDGLEKVAAEKGFDAQAGGHGLRDSPLADYGVAGVSNERLGVGLAGIAGVLAVGILGTGLFLLIRPRTGGVAETASDAAPPASAR